MKIECTKEKLEQAVGIAERITEKNPTLPVLKCVLLSVTNGTLSVRATNLELGVDISIPVKVEREGTVAVPGNVLGSFVGTLYGSKNVTLELVEGNLDVRATKSSTVIKSYPNEDFPIIPAVPNTAAFTVSAKNFTKGLKSVVYSASVSSIKPELASVYIYPNDGKMTFVATDSFRLAEKKVLEKKLKDFDPLLIPFRNALEIARILDDIGGDIDISVSKNQIGFTAGGIYVTSRLVDGSFPDYRQIIPKEFSTEAVVLKQDLLNTLKMSNVFSDKFNQVTFRVAPSQKKFTLETRNADVGENITALDAALSGDDIEVAFNHRYIVDCFQSIESDSISLSFSGPNKPLIIRGVSDPSFMYLVAATRTA
jgi:DNA polymerase III subunit beta